MKIKFPTDMKAWLKRRAAENLRSMSAEVINAVMREMARVEAEKRKASPAD